MLSTAQDEQLPVNTDILIPVDIDGTPLKYDDNPARAAGMAHAIAEHWERVGLFEQLTKFGTVSMSNGRIIACTDKDVIPFILGRYTAKRARGTRVRASRDAGGKRQRAAARAAAASAVDEHLAQHARTAPHTD